MMKGYNPLLMKKKFVHRFCLSWIQRNVLKMDKIGTINDDKNDKIENLKK